MVGFLGSLHEPDKAPFPKEALENSLTLSAIENPEEGSHPEPDPAGTLISLPILQSSDKPSFRCFGQPVYVWHSVLVARLGPPACQPVSTPDCARLL